MNNFSLTYHGFNYLWTGDAFLSQRQAKYALERLWVLTAGTSGWGFDAGIDFLAVTKLQVESMLDQPAGNMPWVPLNEISPNAIKLPFDTNRLPALCPLDSEKNSSFSGAGPFPLDLVAATFILLTRWEEWTRPSLDEMGRHREDASLCARQGFRDRPVLDEWAVVLRSWLKMKNPGWECRLPKPRLWISHDVDHLLYYKNPWRLFRGLMRDTIRQKSLHTASNNLKNGFLALVDPQKDPCVTAIYNLMDMDEVLGEKGTFFFMSAKAGKFDEGYDLGSQIGQSLLSSIKSRGFEIGWHPGYSAAENDELFMQELASIRKTTAQAVPGVRHHFLRWRAGISWKRMSEQGIPFDASVGYSGCLGFRSSTAHFYPAYDLIGDSPLSLEVRPLIIMDGPLFSDPAIATETVRILKQRCNAVNGCLSLLIHNYTIAINPSVRNTIISSCRMTSN